MGLQTEDKKIAFCEALFREACNEAKKRVGSLPKTEQIQMSDFLKAFHGLKLGPYALPFGHIDTEWNEALAIISEYTTVAQRKESPRLPHEIGEAIGRALIAWNNFDKLPAETKEFIKKTHTNFLTLKEKALEHTSHFFNEIKTRIPSLSTTEKEAIIGLLSVYEPQIKDLGKKGKISEIKSSLESFMRECNKMGQTKNPSRDLQSFIIKTQHDLDHFKAANF